MILAATAGHVGVVEILLDKGGDIEAQSERTKDTPLSLACSGGRQEVQTFLKGIEFLLPDRGGLYSVGFFLLLIHLTFFLEGFFHLFQCS